jgi:hypothetical protein
MFFWAGIRRIVILGFCDMPSIPGHKKTRFSCLLKRVFEIFGVETRFSCIYIALAI